MNRAHMPINPIDLDRLVDGEMPLSEQRALLAALGDEAAPWRQLALAFLEAQVLRQACRACLPSDEPAASPSPVAPLHGKVSRQTPRRRMARMVGLMVAVVTAFLLGAWSQRPRETSEFRSGLAAAPAASSSATPATTQVVDRLQVVFPTGPGHWSDPVELPVVTDSDQLAQFWLSEQPVWPPALQTALREAGRHVSERRHWLEVELQDGRHGYVPVSELVVSAGEPLEYP